MAIARESGVTRAAQSLGITQSSASRHLAVPKRYMGAKLIERRGRHAELTEYRSGNPDLSRAFCGCLARLCRRASLEGVGKASD